MRYLKDEFWTDPYTENLDPSEKLLYIYLLTNPLCNVAGIYEIRFSRMAFETGFDKEMIEKILNRFIKDKKILKIEDWIVIVNFVKNQANNPSVLQGVQRILNNLPPNVIQALTASPQPVGYYTILNLTIPNLISGYAEASSADTPKTKRSPKRDEPMDLVQFQKWCEISPSRHIQLIGDYAGIEKPDFKSKNQWKVFIGRNVRAAKKLESFSNEQLEKATKAMEKEKKEGWLKKPTMETIIKFLK